MTTPDIKYLFEPRSIAIIGASQDEEKIGHQLVKNIISAGYSGQIYPINPRGGEILGLPVFTSLEEIADEIDIACIAIPAKYVFEAVESCAANGVKFIPIITSGFSEIGNLDDEKKIVSYARAHGVRILGPNIFGLYSAVPSLNATFGPSDISRGSVAILTQSGALGIAMIGKTSVENLGLSAIISVGNKADLDEADLLDYLIEQPQTKVILMYIEGVRDGQRLVQSLKRATKIKPVVVIKSGRSERGAAAAASHTGSLAGADEIFDDVMRQCGVLRAESLQEAFDWCKFLANAPVPHGENTVILTNGGGIGVLATDACEKFGVKLYDNIADLRETFAPVTPDFGSTKNPIDLTGQTTLIDYRDSLEAALENDNIHAVIAIYCESGLFDIDTAAEVIETSFQQYLERNKPIMFSAFGGETIDQFIVSLRERGVPVSTDVYSAVSCLSAIYSHFRHLHQAELPAAETEMNFDEIELVIEDASDQRRSFLLAHEGQALMKAADIPMPTSRIARSLTEAIHFAEGIGYPVALKIVSEDILHKSDVGGVVLDLENKEELIDAYEAIYHNTRRHKPDAFITGLEVSEMVNEGIEVIIGARRDRAFGPIVMFGLGGIYVEVLKDVSFRALPLNRREAVEMIKRTKAYPLLLGVRGEGKKDINLVIDMILKLGSLIMKSEKITDIEVNPLVVYEEGQGAKAVDVRVLLSKDERSEAGG